MHTKNRGRLPVLDTPVPGARPTTGKSPGPGRITGRPDPNEADGGRQDLPVGGMILPDPNFVSGSFRRSSPKEQSNPSTDTVVFPTRTIQSPLHFGSDKDLGSVLGSPPQRLVSPRFSSEKILPTRDTWENWSGPVPHRHSSGPKSGMYPRTNPSDLLRPLCSLYPLFRFDHSLLSPSPSSLLD